MKTFRGAQIIYVSFWPVNKFPNNFRHPYSGPYHLHPAAQSHAQARYSYSRLIHGSGPLRLGAVVFIQYLVAGADSDKTKQEQQVGVCMSVPLTI